MSFGESYQAFLDKINKRIPIKAITSKLDKNNPLVSFFVFLIVLILIFLLVDPFSIINTTTKKEYNTLEIRLASSEDKILKNFNFKIKDILNNEYINGVTDNTGSYKVDLDLYGEYTLIVEKTGYKYTSVDLDPTKKKHNIIIEKVNFKEEISRKLSFVDSKNKEKINKVLDVTITCSNSDYQVTPTATQVVGSYDFNIPIECGTLLVSAQNEEYVANSIPVAETKNIVEVDPLQTPTKKGEVKFYVKSGENYLTGITVNIFKSIDTTTAIASKSTIGGSVRFGDLEYGDYKVIWNDPSSKYVSGDLDFTINSSSKEKTLELIAYQGEEETGDENSTIEKRTIDVVLKDQNTGQEIIDPLFYPRIELIKDGNILDNSSNYIEGGISFDIVKDSNLSYSLVGKADTYQSKLKEINSSQDTYVLLLEKITPDNASDILANIYDEDDLPIEDADVYIYDSNCDFIDPRFDPEVSDENGDINFSDISQGDFCLKVAKQSMSGTSNLIEHRPPEDTNIGVEVFVGDTSITLNVKDKYNESLVGADVSIFDYLRTFIGTDFTNNSGIFSKELKADNKVYFKIEKEDFLDYYTRVHPLIANNNINKDINMVFDTFDSSLPQAEFIGIYSKDYQPIDVLSQNKEYIFRFKIIDGDYDHFGFKFNIGSKKNVNDDFLQIKEVEPNFENISYYENKDFSSLVTGGDAANSIDAYWSDINAGVYEIDVPVKINMAEVGSLVPIEFWTYLDSTHKSEKIEKIFYINSESLCGQDFCISGQYKDEVEDLVYDFNQGPIQLIINNPYTFNYEITNASESKFIDSRFTIINEDSSGVQDTLLNILFYNIKQIDMDKQTCSSGFDKLEGISTGITTQENFKIPFDKDVDYLYSDQIEVYDSIDIDLRTLPLYYGNTKLNNKIISDGQVVYSPPESYLDIVVLDQAEEAIINATPENILPNTTFNLEIEVLDSDNFPVDNAIINTFIKDGVELQPISNSGATTDSKGKLNVSIPKLDVGDIILIKMSKPGYFAEPKEIEVKSEILKITSDNKEITQDNPLEVNLHKTNAQGVISNINLENLTNFDLVLNDFNNSDISFTSATIEALDLGASIGYLNSQSIEILAEEESNLELKIAPNPEFAINIFETQEYKGSLTLSVSQKNSLDNEFLFNIPINVKLSVGEGVKEDNCLIVQNVENPWTSIIDGTRVIRTEFDIINNCVYKDSEEFAPLHNLKAKIEQKADYYGSYELEISGETGASTTLTESLYHILMDKVDNDRTYDAVLKYIPSGVNRGEVKSDIFLNAEIETDEGFENVNSGSGEKILSTDFQIIRLSDCIDYEIDGKKINNMIEIPSDLNIGDPQEITIKNNCSNRLDFKLFVCQDKYGERLRGCGNLEFNNLNSDNSIEFDIGSESQSIDIVKPEVPGAYRLVTYLQALDSYGSEIMGIEDSIKVNVKDRLYMTDPFIEMVEYEEGSDFAYASEPVELYNNDTNYTPWDYATDKVPGHDGFSKFMSDKNILDARSVFELINFQNVEDMKNFKQDDDFVENIAMYGLGGAAAWEVSVIAGAEFLAIATVSWTVIGIGAVVAIFIAQLVSTLQNDYIFDPEYKSPDVSLIYQNPNFTTNKEIYLSEAASQEEYINVFDITGAKYMDFLNGHGYGHGKLINDETMKLIIPKCNGTQHKYLLRREEFITKAKDCSNNFKDISVSDNQITYKMKCDGSWPRNKIKLKVDAYTICAYDKAIWHEQAGIKPLKFKVNANSQMDNNLSLGSSEFKNFIFYPTLDDSLEEVDPAFENAMEINQNGKFRLEFHSKTQPEYEDPDLNFYDCRTDAGKSGITGPGAVPKVNLNWDWQSVSDINNCNGNYCDGVQLSQEIINRLNKTKNFLKEKRNSGEINPPDSDQELVNQNMDGTYQYLASQDGIDNVLPPGKQGINYVDLDVNNNTFIVKVGVENKMPVITQQGTLNIGLGANMPLLVKEFGCLLPSGSCGDDPDDYGWKTFDYDSSGESIEIPAQDLKTLIFVFGSPSNPIEGENLQLNVNYSGDNIYSEASSFTTDINLSIFESSETTSPQVPATTLTFNSKNYIDLWFNDQAYPDNVNSAWNQEDIKSFKNLLNFDVYLVTDKYNENLIEAFDKAYGGKASRQEGYGPSVAGFLNAPDLFTDGYLSMLYSNNLSFAKKYSSSSDIEISSPGLYNVKVDLFFDNQDWKFVDDTGKIDANVLVTFNKIKNPKQDSVFYRLPFDGFVGYVDGTYLRNNYGLAYLGDEIEIANSASNFDRIKTSTSAGSNPYKFVNIIKENDFSYINSDIETRGNILKLDTSGDNPEIIFSPNTAIPVLLNVRRNINKPFSIYYNLKDNEQQSVYGTNNLTYWSGIGNTKDFSGDWVYSKFQRYSDRASRIAENKPTSYALDWANVAKRGQVNLRSIFYIPFAYSGEPQIYSLHGKTRGNEPGMGFYIPGLDDVDLDVELESSSSQENSINRLSKLMDLVREGKVCVTNSESGRVSEFWWNPAKIYPEDSPFTGNFGNLENVTSIGN